MVLQSIVRRKWQAKNEPLPVIAPCCTQQLGLLFALQSFGDSSNVQASCEIDDRTDDCCDLRIGGNALNETLVDLDDVHGKIAKVVRPCRGRM